MSELVRLVDGVPTTISLVIASDTGNEHRAVLQLIRANLDDMNEVGGVAFEMQPFETAGGTQKREIALMDEPAAALLMTYLRNTPKVKDFKKRLVRDFYLMRQMLAERERQVELPGRRQLAEMVIEAEDRADRESAARVEAEARSKMLEAPASAWKHLADAEGDVEIADAAKILSRDPNIKIGRDRLFSFMAAEGWIYRSRDRHNRWQPYQTQVDNGRLNKKFGKEFKDKDTGEIRISDPTIRVTPKGIAELHKRLGGSRFGGGGGGGQLSLVVVEDA